MKYAYLLQAALRVITIVLLTGCIHEIVTVDERRTTDFLEVNWAFEYRHHTLAFSDDYSLVALGTHGITGEIRILDARTGEVVWEGLSSNVRYLTFSHDNHHLAVLREEVRENRSADVLEIWHLESRSKVASLELSRRYKIPVSSIVGIRFSTRTGTVGLYELSGATARKTLLDYDNDALVEVRNIDRVGTGGIAGRMIQRKISDKLVMLNSNMAVSVDEDLVVDVSHVYEDYYDGNYDTFYLLTSDNRMQDGFAVMADGGHIEVFRPGESQGQRFFAGRIDAYGNEKERSRESARVSLTTSNRLVAAMFLSESSDSRYLVVFDPDEGRSYGVPTAAIQNIENEGDVFWLPTERRVVFVFDRSRIMKLAVP